jgi:hypothetical protein
MLYLEDMPEVEYHIDGLRDDGFYHDVHDGGLFWPETIDESNGTLQLVEEEAVDDKPVAVVLFAHKLPSKDGLVENIPDVAAVTQ